MTFDVALRQLANVKDRLIEGGGRTTKTGGGFNWETGFVKHVMSSIDMSFDAGQSKVAAAKNFPNNSDQFSSLVDAFVSLKALMVDYDVPGFDDEVGYIYDQTVNELADRIFMLANQLSPLLPENRAAA